MPENAPRPPHQPAAPAEHPPEPALAEALEEAVEAAPGIHRGPIVDRPVPLSALDRAGFLLVTCFGIGHVRPASGTWGSLPPCALVGLAWLLGLRTLEPFGGAWLAYHAGLLGIVAAFFGACVVLGPKIERRFGEDPYQCVGDEVAGMAVALLFPPAFVFGSFWWIAGYLAIAFLAFRAFDVLKVQPANSAQDLPHGWGIGTDDLIAGVYALAGTQLVVRVGFPMFG